MTVFLTSGISSEFDLFNEQHTIRRLRTTNFMKSLD